MSSHGFDLEALAAGEHSIFSPSSSAMWLNCSGSLIPNVLAEDECGIDAATGTVAHGVGEQWLKSGVRPSHLIGTVERVIEGDQVFDIEIDLSMLDYVGEYVDWCQRLGGEHFVETRVYFSDLTPIDDQGGTSDHTACEPKVLTVTDLKFGQGVKVYAENNSQAMLYAYGSFLEHDWFYDFQEIVIRIAQPRLRHFDEWVVSRADLLKFAEWVKIRAAKAWVANAPRTPGVKQCTWCRVKSSCMAFVVFQQEMIDLVFKDSLSNISAEGMREMSDQLNREDFRLELPAYTTLSTEQMAKLLPFRGMMESWWKELADELERRALRGNDVPGYKLVEGRSNRKYVGEKRVVETLEFIGLDRDEIYETSVVSITKAENAIRKLGIARKDIPDLMKGIVYKSTGKPTLVQDSDKRISIHQSTDDVFSDLTDDQL